MEPRPGVLELPPTGVLSAYFSILECPGMSLRRKETPPLDPSHALGWNDLALASPLQARSTLPRRGDRGSGRRRHRRVGQMARRLPRCTRAKHLKNGVTRVHGHYSTSACQLAVSLAIHTPLSWPLSSWRGYTISIGRARVKWSSVGPKWDLLGLRVSFVLYCFRLLCSREAPWMDRKPFFGGTSIPTSDHFGSLSRV